MGFKLKLLKVSLFSFGVSAMGLANAAEWKSEPSVFLKAQYNDNVRMRADNANPQASSGYTVEPRVKLSAVEFQRWDMSFDARGKITRYADIEDGDSENIFFKFDSGKQTELTDWRLNANYSRNTNFDTDFDTQNPDSGLADRTERTTATIAPSVRWNPSEISQYRLSLDTTQVTYAEVSNFNYRDYDNNSLNFNAFWRFTENHQLGFTTSYTQYDSPEIKFSYNQTILQLDYTYTINPYSDISFSLGGRNLDSLREDITVSCVPDASTGFAPFLPLNGECPDTPLVTPVITDITNEDTGTVTNISYTSKTELSSHQFKGGRTISPSSFGGASEIRSVTYQYSVKNTERFTTKLLLDASDSSTVSGTVSSRLNDRTQYRVEPSATYKLNKNWNLQISYRYISVDYTNRPAFGESASNAVYVNLYLHWPKFITTY